MTDTTDIAALVERLRRVGNGDMAGTTDIVRAALAAADLIERQAAELERCRKDAARWLCLIDRQSNGPFMSQGLSKDQLDADFDEYINAAIDWAQAASQPGIAAEGDEQ